jgi:two-component system, sensor histidine kinase and response regulator
LKLRRLAAERSDLYAQVKQQRDDLQRLQLQKEQLVAFLVHDLKNPVNAIELHAQVVLRHAENIDRSRLSAGRIHDQARALSRMITDLLDISRADEGRLVPAVDAIDVAALVRGVLDELDVRASQAGVRIAASITAPTIRADRDLIARVLANLIDNAIRYAPEETEVRVTVRPEAGGVELRVADAGPGVPQDLREVVFERFRSGSDIVDRSNRGLGLAFCKLAVEAHGGRIWIEDASPGTVFCVKLADDAR